MPEGSPRPLDGLKVVEFSHMVMGPSAGLVLADLGAEVIKVEPTGEGDKTRRLAGSGAGFFPAFNRNKRSIQVDLKQEAGLAFLRRLVAGADVVLENFRPGALDAISLGYEALSAYNPRLVYASLKGFLTGPYEQRTALDEVVQMMGGLAYMTGPAGRPLRAGSSVNDILGGMMAVIAVLAAIEERHRTGRGRLIKAGLFETNMLLVAQHMMQYAATGTPARPMPERLAAWAVYDVFDTADSQIFVGAVTDGQWHALCEAFGFAALAADAELSSNRNRVLARERFMPTIREAFAKLPSADIAARAEAIGIPFAPINRPDQMFDDPHLAHPGAMVDLTLADGTKTRVPALPLEFDGARLGLHRDLPQPGEHTGEVARELGFGEAEIESLFAARVLAGGGD